MRRIFGLWGLWGFEKVIVVVFQGGGGVMVGFGRLREAVGLSRGDGCEERGKGEREGEDGREGVMPYLGVEVRGSVYELAYH